MNQNVFAWQPCILKFDSIKIDAAYTKNPVISCHQTQRSSNTPNLDSETQELGLKTQGLEISGPYLTQNSFRRGWRLISWAHKKKKK